MSLNGAILAGQSALNASQAAIQVASNNIANAATPGYSRQTAELSPIRGLSVGNIGIIGRGVQISDVTREINQALQGRLWTGIAEESAAAREFATLSTVEGTLNELTDFDLSTSLSDFFNAWSERANLSESSAVVVQQGEALASNFRRIRTELSDTRRQIDDELASSVARADELLSQVADINRRIGNAEGGTRVANTLRDQRDAIVSELSQLLDVSVVEQSNGLYDVLVGSTPIVLGATNRGLELRRNAEGDSVRVALAVGNGGREVESDSGAIGGLFRARNGSINEAIDDIDDIAAKLIFEVNKLHATSTNAAGYTQLQSSVTLTAEDQLLPLNDGTNASIGRLPFGPQNGGFLVHVENKATGEINTVRIDVDLDGINDAGLPGITDDTSAEDIRAALAGIGNLNATFTGDGRLSISSDPGFSFSFSDDSSDVLAALGVNSYFTGRSAASIDVRADLSESPSQLGAGRLVDGRFVENATALSIAELQGQPVDSLNGESFSRSWSEIVQSVASSTEAAGNRAISATIVRENLDAQRAAVSGVNIDEESINLLDFQRQYQGAARVIQTADELFDTLLAII
ncbi:MAG: flagellar hook-associated protein FlgK [Planctomycetota bacterium]